MANLVDLILLEVNVTRHAGASGRDPWQPEEFQQRYRSLFIETAGETVIAVDHYGKNHPVQSPAEIYTVWREQQEVMEVLVIPNKLWTRVRVEALA